jgi:glycerophosphoryl diester phosphodiesterase
MGHRVLGALDTKPFAVVAHRLGKRLGPENTLRALEASIRSGAEIAEADVRVTRDGVPVIIHDEEVRDPSGVRVRVSDATYERLSELMVEPLLTLSRLLESARGRILLFLELKDVTGVDTVLDEVGSAGMESDVAFISFHEEALVRVKERAPGVPTGLLYFKPPGKILECKRIGCDIVLPRYNVATQRAVRFAHRMGLKVVAWTINEPTLARVVASRGVNGIATDDPPTIIGVRREISGEEAGSSL